MATGIKHIFHWELHVYEGENVTIFNCEKAIFLPTFLPAGSNIVATTSALFSDDYFLPEDYVYSFTIENEEVDIYLADIYYDQDNSKTQNLVEKLRAYLLSAGWKVETKVEKSDKVAE